MEEVTGEKHGTLSVAEATYKLADFDHPLRVETIGGFVENDQVGVAEEGVSKAEALFHSH